VPGRSTQSLGSMRDPALDPRRSMLGRILWATISFFLFAVGALMYAVWSAPTSWVGAMFVVVAAALALYSVFASTDSVVRSSRRLTDIFIEE
jgi:hypothetical protein